MNEGVCIMNEGACIMNEGACITNEGAWPDTCQSIHQAVGTVLVHHVFSLRLGAPSVGENGF